MGKMSRERKGGDVGRGRARGEVGDRDGWIFISWFIQFSLHSRSFKK
jgi:hypothetical protein